MLLSLVLSSVQEGPVLPRLDRLFLIEDGEAVVTGYEARHQHPALRCVQKSRSEARVPILEQKIDPFDSEREQLTHGLWVRVESHGPIADRLPATFLAAFQHGTFDDNCVLRQGHLEDGGTLGVEVGPLIVLVDDDLHGVVVIGRGNVGHHLLQAEQGCVLKNWMLIYLKLEKGIKDI